MNRFLNVEYSVHKTRINVTNMQDLSELQIAVKEAFSIEVGYGLVKLYNTNSQLITDLNDITPEDTPQYYQKLSQGGACVVIGTSPVEILVNTLSTPFGNFTVHHPPTMPASLLTPLLKLDALLNNVAIFATFPLGLSPENLRQIFSNEQLAIRFVRSKELNASIIHLRETCGEDVCCDGELGWFDSRVSANSVYINYDYYHTDGSNTDWLQMLIFITTMHELCHFLVHHSKIESPTHSSFGEEKIKAGECWELQNLGGIVNHAASSESPLLVKRLHTYTSTGDWYLSPTSIEQLDMIMTGQKTFPLTLNTTDEDISGLQKFKSERHCVESPTDRPFIPYTGPKLIKFQRKPDRKGPRK